MDRERIRAMDVYFFQGNVEAGIDSALELIEELDMDDDDDAQILKEIISKALTSPGSADFIRRLAESDFDASIHFPDGETIPTLYASRGHSEADVYKMLESIGADVTSCNRNGSNALHILASMEVSPWDKGREGQMADLVKILDDPTLWMQCDAFGATPMHLAVLNRHHKLLNAFLDSNIDPDSTGTVIRQGFGHVIDFDGATPLHLACLIADTESVELLIRAGANPLISDSRGRSSSHYAVSPPPLNYCRGYDSVPGKDAVNSRKKDILKTLPDIGRADDSGSTPLILVLTQYRYDDGGLSEALISAGADPNAVSNNGLTALMIAASNGHHQAVKALISAGVRLDDQDPTGRTALHHAIAWRDEKSARLMIKKGARYDIPDHSGVTAGEMAASAGMESVLELMI